MDYLLRAAELYEELVAIRRHLHRNPQVGMDLTRTADYVERRLNELDIPTRRPIPGGVTATIGQGGKTILLRADMDALPICEDSGLDFASTNGAAHACGHDLHTAMLLGAARLLKENEQALSGTVKLFFQPGEEIFAGARAMLEAGALEDPHPDAALAFHMALSNLPVGHCLYNDRTAVMYANTGFRITVRGRGAHGSYPQNAVDPISIGSHICLALQELLARETDPAVPCVLTLGSFHSGTACNIIPDTAVLEGTLRTPSPAMQEFMVRRMREIAETIAAAFRGSTEVQLLSQVPPLICDPELTRELLRYLSELEVPGQVLVPDTAAQASEDFSLIAEQVPSCYMFLGAGFPGEDIAPVHNPRVRFNEAVLPQGAAYLAHCADRWLRTHT